MKWTEGGDGEFENPPCGSHLARCYALIDLGTHVQTWQGHEKKVRQVRISFELPYCRMQGENNPELAGKPFVVHRTYTQSLHKKATLRQHLEGWRGKRFSSEELEEFEPENLVGQPCRILLVENDNGYINIDSLAPVSKEEREAMPKLETDWIYFDLDKFDEEEWGKLTERTQKKIMGTPEWRKRQQERYQANRQTTAQPKPEPEPEMGEEVVEDYGNIPF